MAYKDPERRVIWANQAMADYLGVAPQALVGSACPHRHSERCDACPVDSVLATGNPQAAVATNRDGTVWSVRAYPVRDDEGAVVGVVEIARDITHQHRAEHELSLANQRLRLHFGLTPLAIIEWDRSGKVAGGTRQPSIFGYTRAEALRPGHLAHRA